MAVSPVREHWPSINMELLPPEEQLIAWRVSSIGLRGLLLYSRGFQVALSLFDFAKANVPEKGKEPEVGLPFNEWMYVAGRDGALTIFHFGKALCEIRDVIFQQCPALKSFLEPKAFKSIVGSFNIAFPRWEAVRHAIAHDGELHTNPIQAEEHYVHGPAAGIPGFNPLGEGVRRALSNVLIGRRFVS